MGGHHLAFLGVFLGLKLTGTFSQVTAKDKAKLSTIDA
jgi:hypothetical protein